MDILYTQVLAAIEAKLHLEPVAIPPELAKTTFPLKALDLRMYNWKADSIRKMYCMRFKVRIPSLNVLGMAIYPQTDLDVPIFQFDLSLTKKIVVSYVNFIALFHNEAYMHKYIEPLQPVYEKYKHLPPEHMREWMLARKNPYTIYSKPDPGRLDELKKCVMDYLEVYLDILSSAQRTDDSEYQHQIEQAHAAFREDLVGKDRSQKMLGKIIGKKKASRIFNELIV